MKRRQFIRLFGCALACPLAARAQQAQLPTIGFLGANTASSMSQWTAAFVQRLRELGWIEGRTITIDYRWAEGRLERGPEIFAEFIRLNVDVIVTNSTALAVAAKQSTTVIPIVFATAGDPVGNGIVASLARPGGNVTGLSVESVDVAGKRIELLREVVPGLNGWLFWPMWAIRSPRLRCARSRSPLKRSASMLLQSKSTRRRIRRRP